MSYCEKIRIQIKKLSKSDMNKRQSLFNQFGRKQLFTQILLEFAAKYNISTIYDISVVFIILPTSELEGKMGKWER